MPSKRCQSVWQRLIACHKKFLAKGSQGAMTSLQFFQRTDGKSMKSFWNGLGQIFVWLPAAALFPQRNVNEHVVDAGHANIQIFLSSLPWYPCHVRMSLPGSLFQGFSPDKKTYKSQPVTMIALMAIPELRVPSAVRGWPGALEIQPGNSRHG